MRLPFRTALLPFTLLTFGSCLEISTVKGSVNDTGTVFKKRNGGYIPAARLLVGLLLLVEDIASNDRKWC